MTTPEEEKCWICHDNGEWTVHKVLGVEGDFITVDEFGEPLKVLRKNTRKFDRHHMDNFTNVFEMSELNEPSLLGLLKRRYDENNIYTFIGDVLLSVNPYKEIDGLYDMPSEEKPLDTKVPHVFLLADAAVKQLAIGHKGTSQSILINGESGAGKTYAAKQIMGYLADLSNKNRKEQAAKSANQMNNKFKGLFKRKSMKLPGMGGNKKNDGSRTVTQIEKVILQANIVLEAFGNAKTIRNNNSSRFGKFVQVEYDGNGLIEGGMTRHFLLEKSRIVYHDLGESNYHIFYQLCDAFANRANEDAELNEEFKLVADQLSPAETYSILFPTEIKRSSIGTTSADVKLSESKPADGACDNYRLDMRGGEFGICKCGFNRAAHTRTFEPTLHSTQSKTGSIKKKPELKKAMSSMMNRPVEEQIQGFKDTVAAMDAVMITEEERASVWKLMLIIMMLGNLKFESIHGEKEKLCKLDESDECQQSFKRLALHLGVSETTLQDSLCYRSMRAGKRASVSVIPLDPNQANESRDGLCKTLYSSLFEWVVQKVNHATSLATRSNKAKNKKKTGPLFIGILDIFGFEVLQKNSFEQLCINYANEVLQHMFDHHVFRLEKEMYVAEDISYAMLSFRDNQSLIDLLDGKTTGIFALCDEVALLGSRATDNEFLTKINDKHNKKNGHYSGMRYGGDMAFQIQHFAGPVVYQATGMVGKNIDALQGDLEQLMTSSAVTKSFPFITEVLNSPANSLSLLDEDDGVAKKRKMAKLESISYRFRSQMHDLQKILQQTDLHFLRCINPNENKSDTEWDAGLVMDQLHMLGVLEMVRVRQEGFPVRSSFADIRARFEDIIPFDEVEGSEEIGDYDRRCVAALMVQLVGSDFKGKSWQLGKTKCFLRDSVMSFLDEKVRVKRASDKLMAEAEAAAAPPPEDDE